MSVQEPRQNQEKPEKRDEKDEKERGEKARNDPLSAVAWAAVLIWAGIVFLAQNLAPALFAEREPWPVILVGAGVIFLLEALVRTQRPEYRRPVGGTIVWAVILIAVGLGEQIGWGLVGPIALIAVGAGLLLAAALRRR